MASTEGAEWRQILAQRGVPAPMSAPLRGDEAAGNLSQSCAKLDMAGAVALLEALFSRAQSDLSYVACRMEQEFTEEYTAAGCGKLNPGRLLNRLTDLGTRMEALKRRSDTIAARKEDLASNLQQALTRNVRQVEQLRDVAALDFELDHEADLAMFAAHANGGELPEEDGQSNSSSSSPQADEDETENAAPNFHPAPKPTKAAKPAQRNVYDPKQEFESVSELVRGRVKLRDVNAVYEAICEHFSKKKAQALTTQDMTTMGLRITGQTGVAKLKVLRALKIIHMNKEGVTLA